jgi:hypothetical protein
MMKYKKRREVKKMKKMIMLLLIGGILLLSSFAFLQEDLHVNSTSKNFAAPGAKEADFPGNSLDSSDTGLTTNGGGGCGSGDPAPG